MTRYTLNTICDSEELKTELSRVRKQGFSVDNEEHEEGIFCLAAPIVNGYDETVAAMSVSKPVFRLDKASLDGLSAAVRQSCETVSRILGHV
ncbi:MAG: IclR family transcriptional regulator C-terminal domain-containing protein [Spirochaetales bacterium]